MPELLMTKRDAEELFQNLQDYKRKLGYIPQPYLGEAVRQVARARTASRLRFFNLLAQDDELLKAFWEKWSELGLG
jgi:hypothetical protein